MKIDPNFIGLYMHKINKTIRNGHQEILEKHGLNKRHIMHISTLHKHPEGFTLVELTNHLGIDKSHTTRIVNDLLNKKIIKKVPQDGMKFKYKVMLTEEGKKIGDDLLKHAESISKTMSNKLNEEDLVRLEEIFKKITEDM